MAQNNYNWPINPTTVNSGPVQFEIDGAPVTVNIDTGTPANSTPLPVTILDPSGLPTDFATETTQLLVKTAVESIDTKTPALGAAAAAASVPVVLATDQPAIPTKAPVNTAGSYDEIVNLTTSAQTFTVPANAVGFVIETLSSNSDNIRYKIGAAATISSGMRLEPGRSENYNSGPAANISVIAETGTNQVVSVQWILSQ